MGMFFAKPKMLKSGELMDAILNALEQKRPFSVVSVGITESFVLAQYTVLTEEQFMDHQEAYVAAWGLKRGFDHRGIRFPNTQARDMAAEALKSADVVGYNIYLLDSWLTREVFYYYKAWPGSVFESHLRRVIMFSQKKKFEQMLSEKKILLLCAYADEVKAAMAERMEKRLGFKITGAIKIEEFADIPRVKKEMSQVDFDLCLLAAGTNALILAPYIAGTYGKVAFDLGQGMESLITGKVENPDFLEMYVSIEHLMRM